MATDLNRSVRTVMQEYDVRISAAEAAANKPVLAALSLASASVTENTVSGATISGIIGKTAGSTLSLANDDGGRFAISGNNLVAGLTNIDYEAASSRSIVLRETLAGATNSPRDTPLAVGVVNVNEQPSLRALLLSSTSLTIGTAATGSITQAATGSTITASGLPAGFTINGSARTWAYDGSGPASTPTIALTETLGDSPNSPRTTSLGLTIANSGAAFGGPATQAFMTAPSTRKLTFTYSNGAASTPALPAFYAGNQTLDLRTRMAASWVTMRGTLTGLWTTGGAGQSYIHYFNDAGRLSVAWATAGGVVAHSATAAISAPRWDTLWVRSLVNTAAGTCQHFISTDGTTWTPLGATGTGLSTAPIVNPPSSTALVTGNYSGSGPSNTWLYYAEVYEQSILIGGAEVMRVSFDQPHGATSFNDAAGRVWTVTYPAVLTITKRMKGSAIRIRGGVLVQAKGQWPKWPRFWSDWDWNDFIKPQIDAAKAVGFNVIQVNGDGTEEDGLAYPSDATFKARIEQLCAYAKSIGIGVFWQFGYRPAVSFNGDGSGLDAACARATKIGAWVNAIDNIIGADAMNEVDLSVLSTWDLPNARARSDMLKFIHAIRSTFNKPLTVSVAKLTLEWAEMLSPFVDFHNFHNYDWQYAGGNYQPKNADLNAMKATPWWRGAFVIGETGMPLGGPTYDDPPITVTEDMRRAWFTSVNTQISDADSLGALQWAIYNTTGPGLRAGNWGSVDDNFVPYPHAAEPIRQWPAQL